MKQLNKIVSGGGYTAGKAVLRYKDNSISTGDFFVDGMGEINHFLSDYDAYTDFCQISDNYYVMISPKKENTSYFLNVRLYKRNGAEFTFIKSFEFSTGANCITVRAENISLNRVMIAYVGASSYGKAVVMTLDTVNETVSFTAEYTFLAAAVAGQLDIIKTEDNRCLIAYGNNSGYLNTVIATYLAPDIIFGSALQLTTAANASMIRIVKHDASKYVILAAHTVSAYPLNAYHVSITGSTITSLHSLTIVTSASGVYGLDIQVLDVGKLVVVTNNNTNNNYRTSLIPLIINGSDQITLGTILDTGSGGSSYSGLCAYDKTNKFLWVLHDLMTMQKYVFDNVANTFSEDISSKKTNLVRIGTCAISSSSNVANNRVIPLTDTQMIFFCPSSGNIYTGGKFFLFDVTKIDRPEVLGIAISASEYVQEGLVGGLSGLIAGKKYFVDANGNLKSEDGMDIAFPTIYGMIVNVNVNEMEYNYIGIAISDTELVIPNRKKRTYIRSVAL